MRFAEGYPIKPANRPYLVERPPYCSECVSDLIFDGDEYVCPTCGSSFAGEEDGPASLYPEWSGEDYSARISAGDSITDAPPLT